jgi:putative DNA methylase
MTVKSHKKLIEVALPLEAINVASAREKSIRHGHPSTLHLWWARRPLAAARAVIFAQMVDDPSSNPDLFPTEKKQEKERQRLFKIIEDLVQWDNTTNENVLQVARDEIWQSWRRACAENADHPRAKELFDRKKLPGFHDPFAGGGAIPLEAQRLGLESYASDLNPVAVLINKAMIEIPPRFADMPPVNQTWRKSSKQEQSLTQWKRAEGFAEDVRYYGQWMRAEAEKRIGHLYPKIEITAEMAKERPDLKKLVGEKLTVIAWLWARTVKSPNPAFRDVDVPLASTFLLCSKEGKEAYIEPVIEKTGYRFKVKVGKPKDAEEAQNGTKLSRGANFKCVMSGTPIGGDYIKAEGKAGRMGERLMAIVVEGERGRIYLAPTSEHERIATKAKPEWKPEVTISGSTQYLGVKPYGMERFDQLFTNRQLVALTMFSDLVTEAMRQINQDAIAAGLANTGKPLHDGGNGASAYAEAIGVYLAFTIDKATDYWSTVCSWHSSKELIRNTFGRQAIQMTWDYAETNPFSDSAGNVSSGAEWAYKVLTHLPASGCGFAAQGDAQKQTISADKVVSTDPPYYDNVPYADLSDFFYIWLRRSLRTVYPDLFATLAVPKVEELVAFAYRHKNGKAGAEAFFLDGMTKAMHRLVEQAHPAFPVTIYYAFKQAESDEEDGTASTGWDTFLEAVIRAGFATFGTWPMRTELANRMRGAESNALASSIILVCRPRAIDAPTATRRDFVAALKRELPDAVRHLQAGFIAPVDLAQAAIGPGMAVYTRYAQVLDAEGKPLTVREALSLINQMLDEALAEQEGDFDADSRWALAWFEQYGFSDGEFGVAETLTKAKNTSVEGLVEAGILESKRGKVRLLAPDELPNDWDPDTDNRLTNWETVHHLIRVLGSGGESAASELVSKLGTKAETARELAYRLYALCERKKRANDALAYNGLVQSWPELVRLAQSGPKPAATKTAQADLI